MRAFAACQFTLDRFGAWRTASLLLAALASLCLLAWLLHLPRPLDAGSAVAVALAVAVSWWFGVSVARVAPMSLRWDTRAWHLGPAATAGREPVVGDLIVSIDLGRWMLLRFVEQSTARRRNTTWIPAQRRGHEAQWHALRCAVYSPRPAPGADAEPDA